MATWMEVQLLSSREPALINIELIQFIRPSSLGNHATTIFFSDEDSIDVTETYERVCSTVKAR